MAAGRFGVHLLAPRRGSEGRVVAGGATVLGLGVLVLALAPAPGVALAGAVVAGCGVSVLAPTLFSAVAARSAPGRQGADLALVTSVGYAGFVVGPAVVGLLSELLTLPAALASLALLAAAIAVTGPLLLARSAPADAAAPR